MTHNLTAKKYRIGEFARYLGVTQDFLKHYEECHLLAPYRSDSGYRYFAFNQTPVIMESMRLRSYGIPVRSMEEFLNDKPADETFACLDAHAEEIEKRIERDTVLLESHRKFKRWLEAREGKLFDWEIRESEGFYFLPHSDMLAFMEDDRIYEILPAWTAGIPVVKSTIRFNVRNGAQNEPTAFCWGLSATEKGAARLALPFNDAVQYVPPARALLFHVAGAPADHIFSFVREGRHPVYDLIERCGLVPRHEAFLTVRFSVQRANPEERKDYGSFIVPLAN